MPLSLMLARAGLRVGIYDTSLATVERIGRGEMPFLEEGADDLLTEVLSTGRLALSTRPELLCDVEQVIVVIGTPIDEFLNPSMAIFESAVDELAPFLADRALIVLRSTVYPGTTEYVTRAFADRGKHVDIAFAPERIAEGHALEELGSLPQIIGADTERAGDRAAALFARLGPEVIRTTSREAELAKLFTNAWRYMKFAVANQFFMVAHDAGVDYNRVLHAVRENYPRAADLPGPGFAAGPCLLKDTMQLAAFTTDHFPLGHTAMQVNEGLPAYVVSAMERRYGSLRGRCVGIIGTAFKAESDDMRSSLSYKLRKLLAWKGARVVMTDPYVADDRLIPLESVMEQAEILVLGAPHKAYRELEVGGRDVVDVWGVTGQGIRL
ncbi:MAG: nucleotide sugar dehydrogenase [Chloroflexota bacterium]|nr:nucleotide sugar dehydrogenase [Chloroflexota bacterium]